MAPKCWYFGCLLFLAYSLAILSFFERYEVTYVSDNDHDEIKAAKKLVCGYLKDLYPNATTIKLEQLQIKLNGHSQKLKTKNIYKNSFEGEIEMLSNRIQTKDYFVLLGFLCFLANDLEKFHPIPLVNFRNYKTREVNFVLNEKTFDLAELNKKDDKISQVIVLNEGHLSGCSQSNSRFFCLNKCFKKKFRLSSYHYNGNETGIIHLNYSNRNETIKKYEKSCFEKCKTENCKLVYLISYNSIMGLNFKNALFKARPVLSEFDFWTQLAGITCLFLGITFHHQLSIAVKFICLNVKKIRRHLAKLRWIVLCTSMILFFCLLLQAIFNFKNSVDYPFKKEIQKSLIEPEETHLVICVPFRKFLTYRGKIVRKNFNFTNRFLLELSNESDTKLDDTLDSTYLSFHNKTVPIRYRVQPKVLFRYSAFGLQRCFHLTLNPAEVEPRYQMLLSMSKLKIKFKTTDYMMFIRLFQNLKNRSIYLGTCFARFLFR